jgi:hypothetical protein
MTGLLKKNSTYVYVYVCVHYERLLHKDRRKFVFFVYMGRLKLVD